jgi:hypothetical protein
VYGDQCTVSPAALFTSVNCLGKREAYTAE